MDFLTVQELIGKLQALKERVNDIQEDMNAQALFSKHYSKKNLDGSGYT